MLVQAEETVGQACWCLLDAQVPQAPDPADPHGPQAAPQQNHEASP
jgi:hypothetical protein